MNWSEFLSTASDNDIEQLLTSPNRLNEVDEFGNTPLTVACSKGLLSVVESLLNAGAKTDVLEVVDQALSVAVEAKSVEIVKELVAHKADVNASNDIGETALMLAARDGLLDVVKTLVAAGANAKLKDEDGHSAIYYAAVIGSKPIVQILRSSSTQTEVKNAEELLQARYGVNLTSKEKRKAIRHGDSILNDDIAVLFDAVQSGVVSSVQSIIERGVNVNEHDSNYARPLYYAAESGNLEIVELLLQAGASAQFAALNGLSPIEIAGKSGHIDVVKRLEKLSTSEHAKRARAQLEMREQNVSAEKLKAFHNAATHGDLLELQKCLDDGVPVDAIDAIGMTALMCAANRGKIEAVNLLLAAGANISKKHIGGESAIVWAARGGREDMVENLAFLAPSNDLKLSRKMLNRTRR